MAGNEIECAPFKQPMAAQGEQYLEERLQDSLKQLPPRLPSQSCQAHHCHCCIVLNVGPKAVPTRARRRCMHERLQAGCPRRMLALQSALHNTQPVLAYAVLLGSVIHAVD